MRSPSPSKATPRSNRPARGRSRESSARSVAPQPALMFAPSGSSPTASTTRRAARDVRGAMALIAPFAQSTATRRPSSGRPNRSHDQVDVALGEALFADHGSPGGRRAVVEKPLDALLLVVGQLPAAREELDAVVLGRVVGGRDDGARVLGGEQRDRRRRQHAAENDVGAAGREPARRAPARAPARRPACRARRAPTGRRSRARTPGRAARPARASGPRRRRRGRRRCRSSVASSRPDGRPTCERAGAAASGRRRGAQRFENCGRLRAFFRPAFLRSTAGRRA